MPSRLGKYQLVQKLDEGGMAEVWLARLLGPAGFEKEVVVKLISEQLVTDADFVEMFLDEGRLAARLSHPNIAQTFELGEVEGRYYLAMERVLGKSVRDIDDHLLELRQRMPLPITLRIVSDLLEALDYAHDLSHDGKPLNIVHRDISPANVMVTARGGVKLLDFGIARAASQKHRTSTGILRGNPGFMAPEQCGTGPIDRRVDVFSAGTVLYLLATGRRAYVFDHGRTTVEALTMMANAAYTPPREANPDLPAELERILLTAMARQPTERYASAGSMLDAIDRFAMAAGRASPREVAGWLKGLFDQTPAKRVAVGRQPTRPQVSAALTDPESDPHNAAVANAQTRLKQQVFFAEPPTMMADAEDVPTAPNPGASTGGHPAATLGSGSSPGVIKRSSRAIAVGIAATIAGMAITIVMVQGLRPRAAATVGSGVLVLETQPSVHAMMGEVNLGTTPLRASLPAGTHRLVLENAAAGIRRELTVTVQAGKTTTRFEALAP